jgi:iron complex outermembrane receptor protein
MKYRILLFAALFTLVLQAGAQSFSVSGKVIDSSGTPIPFAIVFVEGTYANTTSDLSGNFTIGGIKDSNVCIGAKVIGYEVKIICIEAPSDNLQLVLKPSPVMNPEVLVVSTRASDQTGTAFTNINRDEIAAQNYGQDLPYVLNNQTSVVTTSDAGNGVGYTGIRIRGSDATRVNVTINGIPVNDQESQGTFWVNTPDLASSTDNIQLQRGVGTSTNGAGAFGGSLNLQTESNNPKPYSQFIASAGSFNTWRITAKAGTGLIKDHWNFDFRMSQLGSDGFIDRGRSDLRSWYFSGGYTGNKLGIKAITFSGRERTYQCWYGVPEDSIKVGNYTYNEAGFYIDSMGNSAYYKDQVDNYGQDYYQLHFIYDVNKNWLLNWALFATKGKGFYEEYKMSQDLNEYGYIDTTGNYNDLIRRRWLDNWYYGVTYSANYNGKNGLGLTIGGAATNYIGKHFGEVIWATGLPSGSELGKRYYENEAEKSDFNVYVKASYPINDKLSVYGDVQSRIINYSFVGPDSSGNPLPQEQFYTFINPKGGIFFNANNRNRFYLSFCVGNKEPNRDDFTNSSPQSRPKQETLYDAELGWKYSGLKLGAEVNFYYMHYINQLVLTGKVNDVGAYTRENVDVSFRRGIELTAGYKLSKTFTISGNATFSENKILSFTEYIDDYDTYTQIDSTYENTDIAFSPSLISALNFTWKNNRGLSVTLNGKYVGKQYLDNTRNEDRSIDAYHTLNLNAQWEVLQSGKKENRVIESITAGIQVNNLLNTMYSANGYTYGYIYGGTNYRYNYYFPQAGINVMGMITVRL